MLIKGIIFEDFVNYKKISMTIEMPFCDFKCDKECGGRYCQNSSLAAAPSQDMNIDLIIKSYLFNIITEAVVFQGLEPFDSWTDLLLFCKKFREKSSDDIVIYTGYTKKELSQQLEELKKIPNIIIKFGRFIPNSRKKYDEILGVTLASDNQFAEKIS